MNPAEEGVAGALDASAANAGGETVAVIVVVVVVTVVVVPAAAPAAAAAAALDRGMEGAEAECCSGMKSAGGGGGASWGGGGITTCGEDGCCCCGGGGLLLCGCLCCCSGLVLLPFGLAAAGGGGTASFPRGDEAPISSLGGDVLGGVSFSRCFSAVGVVAGCLGEEAAAASQSPLSALSCLCSGLCRCSPFISVSFSLPSPSESSNCDFQRECSVSPALPPPCVYAAETLSSSIMAICVTELSPPPPPPLPPPTRVNLRSSFSC